MFQITTDWSVLTDSVFRVLFAYFDESMAGIGGMNHRVNTVDLTPI